jgi:hypothetical protein
MFILALIIVISFGGEDAYTIFRARAGIDIGHWNSMCVIASFMSLLIAVLVYLFFKNTRPPPIISEQDRADQLKKLEQRDRN